MHTERLLLIGCGILEKEIRYLDQKNHWDLELVFLDSVFHCNFQKLAQSLKRTLNNHRNRDCLVCYGSCHPLMDQILDRPGTLRIQSQNCVEMLLGKAFFQKELLCGAFFLLEDWAKKWDFILSQTYTRCRPEVMREIFQSSRNSFLAVKTPCSDDFQLQAEQAATMMQVPLRWKEVTLEHLEAVLTSAIAQKRNVHE